MYACPFSAGEGKDIRNKAYQHLIKESEIDFSTINNGSIINGGIFLCANYVMRTKKIDLMNVMTTITRYKARTFQKAITG